MFFSRAPSGSVADYVLCVCACVCVIISCKQNISQSYERILVIFFGGVGRDPGTDLLDFGGDLIPTSPIFPNFSPVMDFQ